jgi:hypothetical protein
MREEEVLKCPAATKDWLDVVERRALLLPDLAQGRQRAGTEVAEAVLRFEQARPE